MSGYVVNPDRDRHWSPSSNRSRRTVRSHLNNHNIIYGIWHTVVILLFELISAPLHTSFTRNQMHNPAHAGYKCPKVDVSRKGAWLRVVMSPWNFIAFANHLWRSISGFTSFVNRDNSNAVGLTIIRINCIGYVGHTVVDRYSGWRVPPPKLYSIFLR